MDRAGQSDAISAAFAAQRAKVDERRLAFGLAERREALRKLADAIRKHEAAIIAALQQDFGKPEAETILSEILPVMQEIRHTSRHLRGWMKPKRALPSLATFGTTAQVMAQPRGVCLIIAPWNYPFNLCLGPLVSCLAAGNSAILKPSEMTPATSALIARMIAETFPPDLVTVIEGGKDASQALLALPFDHIFFTGSPAVGRIVMAAAAKNLTSVTLELGGKSPTIVGPDANIEQAAKWILFGKFVNAGQTCIAPDHLFVHRAIKERFLEALRAEIAKAYGSGAASPHLAKIVNEQHAARLTGLLDDAKAKGAQLISGGDVEGRAIGPTLIEAITPEMEIDREEIFGPILPVMTYDDIEPVLARINARPKPLALYVFDRDKARVRHILNATTSGGAGVNLTVMQYSHAGLPFGGVNNSGIGAAHGEYGFRAFSHERAVLRNRFSLLTLIFPPYEGRARRLIDLAKRFLG
ncbi:MAG TPA: aldehyde dehydrogenase family protein [Xanthobacteraceae bacterium]|nr:aldehyde dehydrogenase family protein [Xanthobacteraceae bacterium]